MTPLFATPMNSDAKQQFNQACGQIFEGLALYHGLEPESAQTARALVASSHACRPEELLRHSLVGIADALGMAPASSVIPLIEQSLLAMELARESFQAGAMVDAARQKVCDEDSSFSHVFGRAYTIACSQEVERLGARQADQGDVEGLFKIRDLLNACVDGLSPFFVVSVQRRLDRGIEKWVARAESVAIERCAKPATKRAAPKL